ncbi:unnamed protein product [marine sediment metagenome]|uniref:Uncharacterized protein n=1 Tax=marine sediment metagenome TaxID=412755 RepID=X0SDK8_9ZZZZ
MFIVYWNMIAITCVFTSDEADDYVNTIAHRERVSISEFMTSWVDEDEDLYYSIASRA